MTSAALIPERAVKRDDGVRGKRSGGGNRGHRACQAKLPSFAAGVVFTFFTDEQERVAGVQLGRSAGEPELVVTERRQHAVQRESRPDIPLLAGLKIRHGLISLRVFARTGNALQLGAGFHVRPTRRAGGILHGESGPRFRRHARLEFVTDAAGQFEHAAALHGGAQPSFVGDALAVKRQHLGHRREAV